MLGFASCDTDKEPVLTVPENHSFVLNKPVFADQYLQLTEEGSFELVASQPDYGYAAAAVYGAEVSLTPDFAEYRELTPADPGLARMTFKDSDLAMAMCLLHGFDAGHYEDLPAETVYFRATCQIPGLDYSRCVSNVVSMSQVKFYFAIAGQREIYLIGSVGGWTAPEPGNAAALAGWKLVETGVGTDTYVGTFAFPAGDVEFRFYTELNGWGNDGALPSVGANPVDGDAKDISGDFVDDIYKGTCCPGKGSWKFSMAQEDNVSITVNLKDMTVEFEIGGEANWDIYPCIYLIGTPNGWTAPEAPNADALADWRLYDTSGAGIYVTKEPLTFPAGENYFRFYNELSGWGSDGALPSMGPVPDDGNNLACDFTDGVFNGTWVPGKGSWIINVDAPTKFNLEVNTADGTVRFTEVTE